MLLDLNSSEIMGQSQMSEHLERVSQVAVAVAVAEEVIIVGVRVVLLLLRQVGQSQVSEGVLLHHLLHQSEDIVITDIDIQQVLLLNLTTNQVEMKDQVSGRGLVDPLAVGLWMSGHEGVVKLRDPNPNPNPNHLEAKVEVEWEN